jgi:hypothetical protein
VYELLRAHGTALVIGDRPEVKEFQAHELHDRLDVRALPLRLARPARQLQRVGARGVGAALRGLER